MSYVGHVKQGVVIFDGPVRPPEGAIVRVEEVTSIQEQNVGDALDRLAGQAQDLPPDVAAKHDQYRRQRRS